MRRGQVWSMDIIIAFIIFLLSVTTFYVFTQKQALNTQEQLRLESELIARALLGEDRGLSQGGALDARALASLVDESTQDYDALRSQLGVKGDFCILLVDQEGNIILVGNATESRVGIGNPNLTFMINSNVVGCGQPLP